MFSPSIADDLNKRLTSGKVLPGTSYNRRRAAYESVFKIVQRSDTVALTLRKPLERMTSQLFFDVSNAIVQLLQDKPSFFEFQNYCFAMYNREGKEVRPKIDSWQWEETILTFVTAESTLGEDERTVTASQLYVDGKLTAKGNTHIDKLVEASIKIAYPAGDQAPETASILKDLILTDLNKQLSAT